MLKARTTYWYRSKVENSRLRTTNEKRVGFGKPFLAEPYYLYVLLFIFFLFKAAVT